MKLPDQINNTMLTSAHSDGRPEVAAEGYQNQACVILQHDADEWPLFHNKIPYESERGHSQFSYVSMQLIDVSKHHLAPNRGSRSRTRGRLHIQEANFQASKIEAETVEKTHKRNKNWTCFTFAH